MRIPTDDELSGPDLVQMERWTAWVVRLLSRAVLRATDPTTREWLQGAKEDAESLREALAAATKGWLDAGQVAIVCSIYELWDINHDRTERLAAEVDPIGHEVWRRCSAGARPHTHPTTSQPLTAVS
jgi:hypothetical protein